MDKIHFDKEVWLFGKGPSLDTFDFDRAGTCRVAINHAVYIVPNCYAVFMLDEAMAREFKKRLDKNIWVCSTDQILEKYPFEKSYEFKRVGYVHQDYISANAALMVFENLGVETVHLVGFDSLDRNYNNANKVMEIMDGEIKEIYIKKVLNHPNFEMKMNERRKKFEKILEQTKLNILIER